MSAVILTQQQIGQKIKRIAFQILENNIEEDAMIIAGISGNGYIFARKLKEQLDDISTKDVILCEVKMDKKQPLNSVSTSIPIKDLSDRSIVLVDDVLNSGRTLIHAVRYLLQVPLKQIKTAVLVNRNHKDFPVKSDFKGISLSTSLEEHVEVDLEKVQAILY